jgi:hypothetical protein
LSSACLDEKKPISSDQQVREEFESVSLEEA